MITEAIDEPNKIYIVGSRKVGKSSLLRLLFKQPFIEKMEPSMIGITKATLTSNKKTFTIKDLTDTEDYKCTKLFLNEVEDLLCVISVFSLTDRDSFEHAKLLLTCTQSNLTNNVDLQMILCGNKYDIVSNDINNRAISLEEINTFTSGLRNCKYFDISCKTGYNVENVINMINELEIESNGEEGEEEEKKNKNSCSVI